MDLSAIPWPSLLGGAASAVVGSLYAGADTAITSLPSARIGALIEETQGPTKAALERIQRDDHKLRSRYLLGRIACTVLTALFLDHVAEPYAPEAAMYVALGVTLVVTAILYEVSTTLARKNADRVAPFAARYFRPLEIVTLPLAIPLGWIGERLRGADGLDIAPSDPRVAEAEVELLLEEGAKSGMLGAEPAEMIRNVLEFKDLTARDVMIPRSQVEAIDISTPFDDVLRIVAEGGHSRYPVIRSRLDDVIGLLYAKDLFKASEVDGEKRLTDLVRGPANFVAESRKLSSLLKEMRGRRQHLAIVVDELGAVSGIVTLEDVLEEIVGDIRDEHDEKPIEELGDGHIMVDGAVSLNDLGAYLGTSIVTDGDYDSLNALLTHHLGGIPEIGTTLEKYGLKFVVRDKDERRIGKIEVCSL